MQSPKLQLQSQGMCVAQPLLEIFDCMKKATWAAKLPTPTTRLACLIDQARSNRQVHRPQVRPIASPPSEHSHDPDANTQQQQESGPPLMPRAKRIQECSRSWGVAAEWPKRPNYRCSDFSPKSGVTARQQNVPVQEVRESGKARELRLSALGLYCASIVVTPVRAGHTPCSTIQTDQKFIRSFSTTTGRR